MSAKNQPPKIVQDPAKPEVPAEIIAQSIEQIAKSMRELNSTRLTRKAIVTLIHAQGGVGKREIENVLGCLDHLEHEWLKSKAKP